MKRSIFLRFLLLGVLTTIVCSSALPKDDEDSDDAHSSAGCFKQSLPVGITTDKLTRQSLVVNDPRLDYPVERYFFIRIPGNNQHLYSTNDNHKRTLMVYFHGFMGNALDVATKYEYNLLGREEDMIMIYPEGMSDYVTPEGEEISSLQGWNAVGSSQSDDPRCDLIVPHCGFQSCKNLNTCSLCAFASCHNDSLFVEKILDWAFDNLCIDKSRVVASGLSNGGLMIYELITQIPDYFQAFIAVYGSPMVGFMNFSSPALYGRPLLHIHGLEDEWVPFNGSLSNHNFSFIPATDVVEEYATIQQCSLERERWETPFDTVNNFFCMEYPNCQSGARVILCTYSGGHEYPPMIEEMTFAFLQEIDPTHFIKDRIDSVKGSFSTTYRLGTKILSLALLIACIFNA